MTEKTQEELRMDVVDALYAVSSSFRKLSIAWEQLDSIDQEVLNSMGWHKLVTMSFDEMWGEFLDMALAVETVLNEMKNA